MERSRWSVPGSDLASLRQVRVPGVGFEPTRPFGQEILGFPRLPVPSAGECFCSTLSVGVSYNDPVEKIDLINNIDENVGASAG